MLSEFYNQGQNAANAEIEKVAVSLQWINKKLRSGAQNRYEKDKFKSIKHMGKNMLTGKSLVDSVKIGDGKKDIRLFLKNSVNTRFMDLPKDLRDYIRERAAFTNKYTYKPGRD